MEKQYFFRLNADDFANAFNRDHRLQNRFNLFWSNIGCMNSGPSRQMDLVHFTREIRVNEWRWKRGCLLPLLFYSYATGANMFYIEFCLYRDNIDDAVSSSRRTDMALADRFYDSAVLFSISPPVTAVGIIVCADVVDVVAVERAGSAIFRFRCCPFAVAEHTYCGQCLILSSVSLTMMFFLQLQLSHYSFVRGCRKKKRKNMVVEWVRGK